MSRGEADEVEFLVLQYLDQVDGPLGCGALADYLRQHGHHLSEATAGRLLRGLDQRGLTAKAGFRGRSLTRDGHARLGELRRHRTLTAYSAELVEAVQATKVDDLVEVLVARRALEREVARMAAGRARPEDVQALAGFVRAYEQATSPAAMAAADMGFHLKLAEVAGNRVLQAATRLVHQEAAITPIPAPVSRKMQPTLAGDHRRILETVQAGDPDGAEAAMVHHINTIISEVLQHRPPH